MPTCRRKRVVLTEPSDALLEAAKSDPNKDVYYLEQTGEIFESYEFACSLTTSPMYPSLIPLSFPSAYAARMSFYRLKQFQCEVTGKSGLDYFQAVESEQHEARTMHSRFSEPLKPAILRAVQWRAFHPSSSSKTSSCSSMSFIVRGHGSPGPSRRGCLRALQGPLF
jgi:bromodomain adjacent to zinc finger domain protein 1A